uniref:Uncharacterized protein n=1 Tax=Anguilla anguilla TaxID=7936 RepID=A0A0E9TKZ9_ANGAN
MPFFKYVFGYIQSVYVNICKYSFVAYYLTCYSLVEKR